MRATTANDVNVFDINNSLLHPATVFPHPRDIGADPVLSISSGYRSERKTDSCEAREA